MSTKPNQTKPKRFYLIGFALAFFAGIALANGLNTGLVNALRSVGENIFGKDYFSATVFQTDENGEGVQFDYAPEAGTPVVLNLFSYDEDGGCEAYLRLSVMDEEGVLTVRGIINPEVIPTDVSVAGIDAGIINPDVYPPDPVKCHPPDPILPPDV